MQPNILNQRSTGNGDLPRQLVFQKKTGHLSRKYASNQTIISHSAKLFHSSCRLSHFIRL